MRMWNVPVSWVMSAVAKIEAETLEDAICKAEALDEPLPKGAEYVYGSFQVDGNKDYICRYYNANNSNEVIYEDKNIIVKSTGKDTDVIATVVNKTNTDVVVEYGDDEWDEESFVLSPDDFTNILNDGGGIDLVCRFLHGKVKTHARTDTSK